MMNPEALMAEWMPVSIVSGVTMGAMGAAGSGLYRCVQWKGNFKGSNPGKIVQIKDQVGICYCLKVYGRVFTAKV